MPQSEIQRSIAFVALTIALGTHATAGDPPRSLVLKDRSPGVSFVRTRSNNSAEELWDAFMVMRKANSGDAVAEHELGLRYLLGKNFPADTQKAAFWIRKAADQNLLPARYNLGILLNNGWGLAWNPFEAYKHFQASARQGLPEAEYVYGLLLTDNLIVPRNYEEAYRWIKTAADSGYGPAREILVEFERRGITARIRAETDHSSSGRRQSKTGSGIQTAPQALDPEVISDSAVRPDDTMLLKEALSETREQGDTQEKASANTGVSPDVARSVYDAAEAGSPEALTLIGRWFEQGVGVKQDFVQASVYYLRAIRFDSPWSPVLLWRMTQREGYFQALKKRVDERDPLAVFVWVGLVAFGFDHQLTEGQALKFLQYAAEENIPDALVELAICHYSGYWVSVDREKAVTLLKRARALGSREAAVRLCMLEIKDGKQPVGIEDLLQTIEKSARDGSVLAQAVLGYCYEQGKGVNRNVPLAVQFYRRAAQRGSAIAYGALRQMYDERRPPESEFQIPGSIDE